MVFCLRPDSGAEEAMMIIVGIETSSIQGSVALLEDARVLGETVFRRGMRHGAELIPSLHALLRDHGLSPGEIDLIAVGTGPGSYTGLRVGIAAAKALSYATGAALVGVPSLDSMVAALPPECTEGVRQAIPLVDAKRECVYSALYAFGTDEPKRVSPFTVRPPRELLPQLVHPCLLLGNGLSLYRDLFASLGCRTAPESTWFARGRTHGLLGLARFQRGERDSIHSLSPLYLRLSEAEEKRLKKISP